MPKIKFKALKNAAITNAVKNRDSIISKSKFVTYEIISITGIFANTKNIVEASILPNTWSLILTGYTFIIQIFLPSLEKVELVSSEDDPKNKAIGINPSNAIAKAKV